MKLQYISSALFVAATTATPSVAQDMSACDALSVLIQRGATAVPENPDLFGYPFESEVDCGNAVSRLIGSDYEGPSDFNFEIVDLSSRNPQDVIGLDIYSAGERVGEIDEIFQAPWSSEYEAIVTVGGFLGIGSQEVLVSPSEIVGVSSDTGFVGIILASRKDIQTRSMSDAQPFRNQLPPAPGTGGDRNMPTIIGPGIELIEVPPIGQTLSLSELRSSRKFAVLEDMPHEDFAGIGSIAFLRSPTSSLRDTADKICRGFCYLLIP
ncbi:PRC-barrel domain-containing protein [Roseivivax marinus]|nr:PRC-barrel domain-containing protein [Roseivivax marinus]